METLFSISYYEKHEKELMNLRGVINPESELQEVMKAFDKSCFPEEEYAKLQFVMAKRVSDNTKSTLLELKKMYLKVRKDSGCLGYTTKVQEVQEAGRIVRAFECSCYLLSKFNKKYSLDKED